MANHKSALKRARQNEVRRVRNRGARSSMRSVVTAFENTAADNPAAAASLLAETVSTLAIAAKKGLIPRERASRKIARLTKRIAAHS